MTNDEPNVAEVLATNQTSQRLRETLENALAATPVVNSTSFNFLGYAEAFLIFAKYAKPEEWQGLSAGHDEVWSGPDNDVAVTPEDIARLDELGWRRDVEGGFHRFV